MIPMKMIPACKGYLWGGGRLAERYAKPTGLYPLAESWEISCHPDGPGIVGSGEFAGLKLVEALARHPEMLGASSPSTDFPIIVKLIDSVQGTSLQVHPPDDFAYAHEGQPGKNEMWYVLEADPDATLALGLKTPISPEELRERIAAQSLEKVLNFIPAKPGDCFLIPAGLVHGIGRGVVLAEVQQNSNVTYRVYDYGRLDADGKPRKLHVEKALCVTDTSLAAQNSAASARLTTHDGFDEQVLADWAWFHVRLLEIRTQAHLSCGPEGFECLLITEGMFNLCWPTGEMPLRRGESVFIPAGTGDYALLGRGKALLARA